MIGDIKGFYRLKSLGGVFIGHSKEMDPKGYAEIEADLKDAIYLRVIDIGCDGSLLVLDPKGRCICDIRDTSSILSWFACDEFSGVLIPPGLGFMDKMAEFHRRNTRKGGYNDIVRKMVIITSLHYGKFSDNFLFACHSGGENGFYESGNCKENHP